MQLTFLDAYEDGTEAFKIISENLPTRVVYRVKFPEVQWLKLHQVIPGVFHENDSVMEMHDEQLIAELETAYQNLQGK